MLRLTMYLLCLIAVLLGTPLRQAEAADDFARTLGELGQGHVIETFDGGVGDDAEESILKAGGDTHSPLATILLAMADVPYLPSFPALFPPIARDLRRAALLGSFPVNSARRFAWLQCFLF